MIKMSPEQYNAIKSAVQVMLTRHIGPGNGIGMGELYFAATGKPWSNRINDTRVLRKMITELRKEGAAICSDVANGYYLAQTAEDLSAHCGRLRKSALKKLALEARLRRIALPDLIGQIALELDKGAEHEA
ncbi:MAG: hypothetical protein WC114_01505 [Smithellaceae bacterium]